MDCLKNSPQKRLVTFAFVLCGAFVFTSSGRADPQPDATSWGQRPNVLFIAVDDLRVQLGCYGDSIAQTPNIDKLAQRGMLFERAYCQQALCNPSRTSVMTGCYPHALQIWDLPTHFRQLYPDIVTLPEFFQGHGYFTQNIGKIYHNYRQTLRNDPQSWSTPAVHDWGAHSNDWFVSGEPFGLKSISKGPAVQQVDVADEAYLDGRIAADAILAIRERAAQKQPFFLAVGFWKPHLPFNAPKQYWDKYDPQEIAAQLERLPQSDAPQIALHPYGELRSYTDIPKTGEISDEQNLVLNHGYYAAISFLDAQIGKVLHELDRQGLAENTIVVLWSDHGFHLGEHDLWCKTSNFELDTRVPLLIAAPAAAHPGQKTTALTELVDLYPTLVDLCDLPIPAALQGKSLRPILADPTATVRDAALSQHPRPAYFKNKPEVLGYSLRTNRFRYNEWRDFETNQVVAQELYDHQSDPQESRNLAGAKAYQNDCATLAKSLSQRLQRIAPVRR
ncbi:sulfatase [Blastopirellula sp. J2-11]|uniref:sulfatase n=1 Tax=Blastopirellula sp. J2-11 TaxID=2943192 RepID=UPI0021C70D17|nr:sulfatase [Blastopirellula sp. J2-11]UUO07787.1 sulfatase [Blastopirellula sp. J2-11]